MEGKKRYVAIVLFLLIGLTVFTFANPVEEQKGSKGNGSNKTEVTDKEDNTSDGTLGPVGNQQQNQNLVQVPNQEVGETEADTSYEDALEAVVKAETSFDELDIDNARDLIEEVTDENQKEELTERLDIVEEAIEAIKLVEELEKMVEDATKRNDIIDSADYRAEEEIVEKVDALRNEEVQESLKNRLQILSRILDDNTAPKIEGVEDGETTNENVSITYSDTDDATGTENEVTVEVTLNGEDAEFKDTFTEDGVYVIKLTDEAFNETIVTFTIDKTAPTASVKYSTTELTNGDVVVTLTADEAVTITNSVWTALDDTNTVFEKTYSENTTKVIVLEDKAGNKTEIEVKVENIDRQVAKLVSANMYTSGSKYVEGKNTIYYATNGNTITAYVRVNEQLGEIPTFTFHVNGKDYVVEGAKESFHKAEDKEAGIYKYQVTLKLTEDVEMENGELTFTVSNIHDKAGNPTKDVHGVTNKNVNIIDRTANMVTFTTVSTDNSYVDGKVYYVRNGNTITFRMGTREKFATNPVVTIGGMNVELEYVKYFAQPNHHEYKGTVTIPADANLAEGKLPIAISEVTDLAGNKGFYYQTNGKKVVTSVNKTETTNGKSVVYDNTLAYIYQTFFRTSRNKKVNNVHYVTNGDTVTLEFGSKEKLATLPTVTIGGKVATVTGPTYFSQIDTYQYYATITVDETVELVDGKLSFTISNVKDLVGNEGFRYQYKANKVTTVTQTVSTNGQSVFVDVEGPVVTPSYEEKTIEEDSVVEFTDYPTFEVTDNSGLTVSQELVSGSVNPAKVGTYKLVYKFTDELGNSTTKEVTIKVVDTTAPVISGITDGAYYNTKTTHAIPSATDKNGAVMFIRTELGDVTLTSFLKNEKEIKLVGTYTIWAVDSYGNKSDEYTIHIDPYDPKVLVLDRFENVSGALLPIKPVILEHNLASIKVKLDGQEIPYEKGQQLTKDGKYEMTVTDKAGNTTTVNFTMDSVAPTMIISPLSLGVVDELDINKINSIGGDIILSEDAEFQLLKANKNVTVLDKNIPIYEYVKIPEDGIIDEEGQYILIAYDKAYNITAAKFTVDRTAPVIAGVEDGEDYNTDVTITVTEANPKKITLPIVNITVDRTIKLEKKNASDKYSEVEFPENGVITEEGEYKISAEDIAGNKSATYSFTIDKHAPELTYNSDLLIGSESKEETIEIEKTNKLDVRAIATDTYTEFANPIIVPTVNGVKTEEITELKVGNTYEIIWTVTDNAGNTYKRTVTLNIVDITYELTLNIPEGGFYGVYNGTSTHELPTIKGTVIKRKDGAEVHRFENVTTSVVFDSTIDTTNAKNYKNALIVTATVEEKTTPAVRADYEVKQAVLSASNPNLGIGDTAAKLKDDATRLTFTNQLGETVKNVNYSVAIYHKGTAIKEIDNPLYNSIYTPWLPKTIKIEFKDQYNLQGSDYEVSSNDDYAVITVVPTSNYKLDSSATVAVLDLEESIKQTISKKDFSNPVIVTKEETIANSIKYTIKTN